MAKYLKNKALTAVRLSVQKRTKCTTGYLIVHTIVFLTFFICKMSFGFTFLGSSFQFLGT